MKKLQATVILAMTADGKIADADRHPARFGSARDRSHLEQQIARADGVLFGAGTLRAYGTALGVSDPALLAERQARGQALQPPQIVGSASGQLDPTLRFFGQRLPRWLLTTSLGAIAWEGSGLFERLVVAGAGEILWRRAFEQLYELGLRRLAVLGGGELVAALLAEDLIDNIWLTVCPLLLGGASAPTPVAGAGFSQAEAKRLQLLHVRQEGEEVFLHYRLTRD